MSESLAGRRESYQRYRAKERAVANELLNEAFIDESGADLDALLAIRDSAFGFKPEKPKERMSARLKAEANALKEQLGEEGVADLSKEAFIALISFVKLRNKVLEVRRELDLAVEALIKKASKEEGDSSRIWQTVSRYETELAKTDEMLEQAARANPVAAQAHWLLKARQWKQDFKEHKVIETDAIKAQTERLLKDSVKKLEGRNGIVTLVGPTGSGKTVTAIKIAKTASKDGTYEFVSGHPRMTPDDLISHTGIVVAQVDASQVPKMVSLAQEQYRRENPDVEGEVLNEALASIRKVIETGAAQKPIETKKMLEAVGRAAAEGRPVIIDEFNYIPPEVMARLNAYLSGSEEVEDGFCVIFTGNIGASYKGGRKDLDPALVNRILDGVVEYGFPPQDLNKPFVESKKSPARIKQGEVPVSRDTFQIAMVELLDDKGNLLAPANALEQVWDLARVFATAQQLAGGKDFRALGLDASQEQTVFKFAQVFLSFRGLNQIVRDWKTSGFTKPLAWFVVNDIIRPAAAINPKDAAQLLYLFKEWGGANLFEGQTWADILKVDTTTWNASGISRLPTDLPGQDVELRHYLPSEVVEALSGEELPSYDTLDAIPKEEVAAKAKSREMREAAAEMRRNLDELRREFEALPDIEALCRELGHEVDT